MPVKNTPASSADPSTHSAALARREAARPGDADIPNSAMLLAAGLGLRMRPITTKIPKPMIKVHKRTLIDHCLDRLQEIGVQSCVVNLHYLGHLLEQHLKQRPTPNILFSHEAELLDTGGGIKAALNLLGERAFFAINADTLWLDGNQSALGRLARRWNDDEMDGLLMLNSTVDAYGYDGVGDFTADPLGRLTRRAESEVTPYFFTGVQILHPRLFENCPDGPFSLNVLYDRAIENGRLYGLVHDGELFHVGTPDALDTANNFMREQFPGNKRRPAL